ncbi:MAG: heparinase II/III family protein [Candidatus Hydrogenedentes bacterium]|nr:heparinase II/III family protein [Candidatus Hydrogenedentota bacterium]
MSSGAKNSWLGAAGVVIGCGLLLLACPKTVTRHAAEELAGQVRRDHPRLMLLDRDIPALKQSIQEIPALGQYYASIRASAEQLLNSPVLDYPRDNRNHLLEPARQAVDRIYRLGLVYRLEQDERFARRGIEELLNAARLPDWDPSHFLDTAEFTHAAAIGYDWFYPVLTPDQRALVRDAICKNGLNESLYFYRLNMPVTPRYQDWNWADFNFNWNPVCNGGIVTGALAVAGEAPQMAGEVLARAMASLPIAMREFAPDGGWLEGPGYWDYATSYNVYFLAALETAIGPQLTQRYLQMPGFDKTGEFRLHMVGPLGLAFNFADSRDTVNNAPQMFWLARKFDRPEYAGHAAKFDSAAPSVFDLLWFAPVQRTPAEAQLPLDACFRHVETAFLRSSWDDPNAVYVGFKGGDNSANHGHLDLGSFVLDAGGCRWALDLGRDNYALPLYFEWGKAAYYRLKTEGHNTLVLDGENQRVDAVAPIVAFQSRPNRAFAVADLSKAYRKHHNGVLRGIALLGRQNVLIQDEFDLSKPASAVWQIHTEADIELDGRKATLRRQGKTLTAFIVEPEGAVFEATQANPPPPDAQQPGTRKLIIRVAVPASASRLAVTFALGESACAVPLSPLAEWLAEASDP